MELKNQKTDSTKLENIFPNICAMTSREFHTDPHARQDLIAAQMKDAVTMRIFHEVLRFNKHLFKEKVVLVLNAGVDICFPLWVAKYGAKHVYAVDNSQAVDYVKAVVEDNNMCDKITVIKGRVQHIELPVDKVDVILSNWMGYALLIEDKIRSVIYARDKWLEANGVIFPDCADLLIAGLQNSKNKNQRIDWWRDVYNFNMNAVRKSASIEPQFQKIDPNEILTMPVKVWTINLKKITQKDLRFQTSFYIEITQGGSLEGLLAYFDVRFSRSHVPVLFSTSPWAPYTKWLQTVFYFDDPISVNVSERYHGGISMNHCFYKDGSFGTSTYLELYSGLRSNLSLLFTRNWLNKWLYTDHTNGADNLKRVSSPNGGTEALSQSLVDKQALNASNTESPKVKPAAAQQMNAIKETTHDWSFETMQKELQSTLTPNSKANKNKGRIFEQAISTIKMTEFPKLPVSQAAKDTKNMQNSNCNTNSKQRYKHKPKQLQFNTTNSNQNSESSSSLHMAKKPKHKIPSTDSSISNNDLPLKPCNHSTMKPTQTTENQASKGANKASNASNSTANIAAVNSCIVGKSSEIENPRKFQKPKQKRKYKKMPI